MEERHQEDRTTKRTSLDLSIVQVVATALATVVGAVLASELGVYGTIAGAAVVSIGATCGGAVLQHFFRRTGEEIRSRVPPVATPARPTRPIKPSRPTAAFDPFDPGGEHTRMMAAVAPPEPTESVGTYRGGSTLRPKGWRGYALLAGVVFALAMGTVTVVELVAGKPLAAVVRNESGSGTSWSGSTGGSTPRHSPEPQPSGGATATDSATPDPTRSPSSTPTPTGSPSTAPTPATSPSGSADPTPPPSSPAPGSSAGEAAGQAPSTRLR